MKLTIDVACPKCARKLTVAVADMHPGNHKVCPGCSTRIEFKGDDGRKAQAALDDLERTLKQLGK